MVSSKKKAIALLSGGLDSTVATSCFSNEYNIHALTFDYGQRSAVREIKSARVICEKLGLEHTVVNLPWLSELGGSVLTSEGDIPELEAFQLDDKKFCDETARKVWVPGRNIVFTAIATSFAEAEGASIIIVGWDLEEAATFPDNSREFLEAFNSVLKVGSPDDIQVKAPLIGMTKRDIVELGSKIRSPMELSYSCYKGGGEQCGVCESCMRRKRAFHEAGVKDKTIYLQ